MKRPFQTVFAAFSIVLALGLNAADAEAARLGGGRSVGMQRQSVAPKPVAPAQQAAPKPATPAPAAAPAAAPKRNWLGPIAGLAAGLGIAALLSHFGLGEGVANMLMIALLAIAAIFILKMIFGRRATPAEAPMRYAAATPQESSPAPLQAAFPAAQSSPAAASIPAGFDVEAFLRVAKLNFLRLQAANDAGNLDDIREFVSPEMFAEIQLQITERGALPQQTDVVTLEADLLDVTTEAGRHLASVQFSGFIREAAGAAAAPFAEIWHLSKPVDGHQGWVISGIQQID